MPRHPRPSRFRRRGLLLGFGFSAPFVIGFAVFFAYPMAASAYYSFTDFNLFQQTSWVGLDNYSRMSPTAPSGTRSGTRSTSP